MGRRKKDDTCCQQQKPVAQIKQNVSKSSLKEGYIKNKYKEILGSKEPIVLLEKLPKKVILLHRYLKLHPQNNIIKRNDKKTLKDSKDKLNSVKSMSHKPKRRRSKKIYARQSSLCLDTEEFRSNLWEILYGKYYTFYLFYVFFFIRYFDI